MLKKSVVFFLVSVFVCGTALSQSRFKLLNNSRNGLTRVWLSDTNIVSPRMIKIPRRAHITDSFSASKTLNAYVCMIWLFRKEDHVITLKYWTPSGFLYKTDKVPISVDGSGPNRMRLAGYRFLVKTKKGRKSPAPRFRLRKMRIITIPFAIGGTYISKNSLFGEWKLEIYVDDTDKPEAKIKFKINE